MWALQGMKKLSIIPVHTQQQQIQPTPAAHSSVGDMQPATFPTHTPHSPHHYPHTNSSFPPALTLHNSKTPFAPPHTHLFTRPPHTHTQEVEVCVSAPCLFWSAGEDGVVRQYDTRLADQKAYGSHNVLVNLMRGGEGGGREGGDVSEEGEEGAEGSCCLPLLACCFWCALLLLSQCWV